MGDKITVPHIQKMKQRGEKITCLTAYDYSFARILDEAGVEMLLVGDSLGCVIQGNQNTLAVTMDEMIYHTRIVARGRKRALVIGDMPFFPIKWAKNRRCKMPGDFSRKAGRKRSSSKAASPCATPSRRSSMPAFRSWAISA